MKTYLIDVRVAVPARDLASAMKKLTPVVRNRRNVAFVPVRGELMRYVAMENGVVLSRYKAMRNGHDGGAK